MWTMGFGHLKKVGEKNLELSFFGDISILCLNFPTQFPQFCHQMNLKIPGVFSSPFLKNGNPGPNGKHVPLTFIGILSPV